jgi:hypothetical protein
MINMLKMKKKGQVNQVFIYMMAAIIFGVVIIFGYKAVAMLLNLSEDTKLIQFKMDIVSSIDNMVPTQDRRIKSYELPDKFSKICFFNMKKGGSACEIGSGGVCTRNCRKPPSDLGSDLTNVMCNAWISNVSTNIYLTPMSEFPLQVKSIDPIRINSSNVEDHGYLCVNITDGRFKLSLQGKGDRTQIRAVN